MALKKYNPTTPSQRGLVRVDKSDLWKGKPHKALTKGLTKFKMQYHESPCHFHCILPLLQ